MDEKGFSYGGVASNTHDSRIKGVVKVYGEVGSGYLCERS
jgi:hypothetical protein